MFFNVNGDRADFLIWSLGDVEAIEKIRAAANFPDLVLLCLNRLALWHQ